MDPHILVVLISLVLVCVFSFLAVASWSKARLRERQAFYKSETIRKIAESQGADLARLRQRQLCLPRWAYSRFSGSGTADLFVSASAKGLTGRHSRDESCYEGNDLC